jgi:hypothetical protein
MMKDGFDLVPLRIEQKRSVVLGMIVTKPGRALVRSTGGESCGVKCVDLGF